ncbi:hypothetical protein ACSXDM_14840 (plasmid) [Clostridium perfringens]|nr:hypothetical protein [Clostridium perfringens]
MKTEIKYYCDLCKKEIKKNEDFAIMEEAMFHINDDGLIIKNEDVEMEQIHCRKCHRKYLEIQEKLCDLLEICEKF